MKNEEMSGGQLVHIYTMAKHLGCGLDKFQRLVESGHLAAFLAGSWSGRDLPRFKELGGLVRESFRAEPPKEFKIWKTIKLGTGLKTGDDFMAALSGVVQCDRGVAEMIHGPEFTVGYNSEVDLVRVTPHELGFECEYFLLKDLYRRAKDLGLSLCESEVAPQLFLQCKLPVPEVTYIGMKPLKGGTFCVISYSDGYRLSSNDCRFNSSEYWAFELPRAKKRFGG